jgi:hypothetical protein
MITDFTNTFAEVKDTTDPKNPKIIWRGNNPKENWPGYKKWIECDTRFKNTVIVYKPN